MEVIDITKKNIESYDHCLMKNKKSAGYIAKVAWLKTRFKDGLKIKRIIVDDLPVNFIEYLPIENAWRAVLGKNMLFIHCLFTYPKKYQGFRHMTTLIEECISDAKKNKKDGVAVIVSQASFMADKRIFEKNGFEVCAEKGIYQLLFFRIKKGVNVPMFRDTEKILKKNKDLHLYYSDQCPALAKPVSEIQETCKKNKITLIVHHMTKAKEAQNAPFICGTFGITYNDKVLVERCVSNTRFVNILKQNKII
jgi:hypothetical protein